jgi:uncharacterized protein YndB with AHSA1/START domain
METLGQLRNDDKNRAVRFERRYPARPEAVWAALTQPEKLSRWLADAVAFDERVGGRVDLRFGDDSDQVARGAILAYEPPRVLEYEWHWPGQTSSSVRFELSPDDGGTLLVLDHRGLPRDAAPAYAAGWHAYLDRLGAQFDGDVPDWDARFSEVLPKYRDLSGAR